MCELIGRDEAPIVVVGGTRPLARNHGSSQRLPRSAFLAKRRTLVRLQNSLQDFATVAKRRLHGMNVAHGEAAACVEVAIGFAQLPSAGWNHSDAAPGSVDDFENILEQRL